MPAKPTVWSDYSPPEPELRHLLGSFAELRARIHARWAASGRIPYQDQPELDEAALREAIEAIEPPDPRETDSA